MIDEKATGMLPHTNDQIIAAMARVLHLAAREYPPRHAAERRRSPGSPRNALIPPLHPTEKLRR